MFTSNSAKSASRAKKAKTTLAIALSFGVCSMSAAAYATPIPIKPLSSVSWEDHQYKDKPDKSEVTISAGKKKPVPTETPEQKLMRQIQESIKAVNWNNAAIYAQNLAALYDGKGNYDEAIRYYEQSAGYWEKTINPSWGIPNLIRADHIRTEIELYVQVPVKAGRKLAKFEPESGTYIGMYPGDKRANWNPENVEGLFGKRHAIFLTYTSWRYVYKDTNSYFPVTYAKQAKNAGSAIQIGWEPMNGLDDVLDDEYVRQFAREAKESGIPVFLRYASEMNGEWVKWNGNPQKYVEKFRMIHDIMAKEAPNVAMVWSPNFLPRHNIDEYYPGDAYTDWVGFSLYTIPFSQGKEVPGGNPIDYLRPLYEKYSRKPIMISEGAVSHYSFQQGKDYTDWALGQLGNMYAFLPRLFPKVKAITYFNLDKSTTNYDNQNNNYDLGSNSAMDTRYRKLINSDEFLSVVSTGAANKTNTEYAKADKVGGLKEKRSVFAYVKLPLGKQPYYVALYQGKTKLGESYAQPWDMLVDFSKVDPTKTLTLIAFDKSFKRVAQREIELKP